MPTATVSPYRVMCMCHRGHGYSRAMANRVIEGLGLTPQEKFPRDVTDKEYRLPDGKELTLSVRGMEHPRRRPNDGTAIKQFEPHELDDKTTFISFFQLGHHDPMIPPPVRRALLEGRMLSSDSILSDDAGRREAELEKLRTILNIK